MRKTPSRLAGVVLLATAIILPGCVSSEQPLLERFFDASRLRDNTALQTISTITFEPQQQGIVRTFTIVSVTPQRSDGEMVTKDVTVLAPVILPDGRSVQETLLVTLVLTRQPSVPEAGTGQWKVTRVADVSAGTR